MEGFGGVNAFGSGKCGAHLDQINLSTMKTLMWMSAYYNFSPIYGEDSSITTLINVSINLNEKSPEMWRQTQRDLRV